MDVRRVQNPLTGLSRWKIFDNLRRSLVPFALVFLLLLGWILSPKDSGAWGILILSIIVLPSLLTEFLRKPKDLPFYLHTRNVGETFARQLAQVILTIAFLPYDAVISL